MPALQIYLYQPEKYNKYMAPLAPGSSHLGTWVYRDRQVHSDRVAGAGCCLHVLHVWFNFSLVPRAPPPILFFVGDTYLDCLAAQALNAMPMPSLYIRT
jgi:hypothetical protein